MAKITKIKMKTVLLQKRDLQKLVVRSLKLNDLKHSDDI